MGFLWGWAAVSLSCGVSVGLAEALNWLSRPGTGYPSPAGFRILMITSRLTQCHRSDLPAYGNSAPNAEFVCVDILSIRFGVERISSRSGAQLMTPSRGMALARQEIGRFR